MCIIEGCSKKPYLNFPTEIFGLYCVKHSTDGMTDMRQKYKCKECNRPASYGFSKKEYCHIHAKDDMKKIKIRQSCPGCTKARTFNYIGHKPLYCEQHKKPGMINTKDKRCIHPNCLTQAVFGIPGSGIYEYCDEHKKLNMVNIKDKNKQCLECTTSACYGFLGDKKPTYCAGHFKVGMINIKMDRCEEPGCGTGASYGIKGTWKKLYCKLHKKDDMVDISHKKCIICEKKTASFNIRGLFKPLYCGSCASDDMVDVRNKRCRFSGCDKHPVFGMPGTKTTLYCLDHKDEDMINIKQKKCKCCKNGAAYGHKNGKPEYCKQHKTNGMVNLIHRKCQECEKIPVYGIKGTKKGVYCVDHKKLDMVDVVNKRCECEDCETKAFYGYPGCKSQTCSPHKKAGMLPFPSRKCIHESCSSPAIFGFCEQKHCELHKGDGEFNLVERECISCGLLEVLDSSNRCHSCNPENAIRIQLSKQNKVKAFLLANNFTYLSSDKIIDSGECGKERPDFVFDLGTHIIILEVDENQHSNIPHECEINRMINISQMFDGRNVKFIRYNPDSYKTDHIKYDPDSETRLKFLGKVLTYFMNNPPQNFLEYVRLYYDDFNGLVKERKITF